MSVAGLWRVIYLLFTYLLLFACFLTFCLSAMLFDGVSRACRLYYAFFMYVCSL